MSLTLDSYIPKDYIGKSNQIWEKHEIGFQTQIRSHYFALGRLEPDINEFNDIKNTAIQLGPKGVKNILIDEAPLPEGAETLEDVILSVMKKLKDQILEYKDRDRNIDFNGNYYIERVIGLDILEKLVEQEFGKDFLDKVHEKLGEDLERSWQEMLLTQPNTRNARLGAA